MEYYIKLVFNTVWTNKNTSTTQSAHKYIYIYIIISDKLSDNKGIALKQIRMKI